MGSNTQITQKGSNYKVLKPRKRRITKHGSVRYRYGEISCGIIPISRSCYSVLLIRSGRIWQFPKGFQEKGETQKQTALRETYEEVGIKLNMKDLGPRFTYEYKYHVNKKQIAKHLQTIKAQNKRQYKWLEFRHRRIILFPVLTSKTKFKIQEEEVGGARWFTLFEALDALEGTPQHAIFADVILWLVKTKKIKYRRKNNYIII